MRLYEHQMLNLLRFEELYVLGTLEPAKVVSLYAPLPSVLTTLYGLSQFAASLPSLGGGGLRLVR